MTKYKCLKCNDMTEFKKGRRLSADRINAKINHTVRCCVCNWKWWSSTPMTEEEVYKHITKPENDRKEKLLLMEKLRIARNKTK